MLQLTMIVRQVHLVFFFVLNFACLVDAQVDIATRMYRNNTAGTGELYSAPEFESLQVKWIYPGSGIDSKYLAPIVGKNRVFVAQGQTVICLDMFNGEELWKVTNPALRVNQRPKQYTGIGQIPSTSGNRVFVPSDNGCLLALDDTDGSQLWRFKSEGWISNPVIIDGNVNFTDANGLVVLDIETGNLQWRLNAGGRPEPSCMTVVADGAVYYGTVDGRLHKVSLVQRKKTWTTDLGGREINGTFCYDDGYLYVELHNPIRLLKIDARNGKIVQQCGAGSGLTRSGLQVTGDYLLVFGVHNPGCVHASDLSRFFPIKRRAVYPKGIGMTFDMQYSGATIVGKQILYLNACGRHPSPVWVTRLTETGFQPEIEVEPPGDNPMFFHGYRAPSCYFPPDTDEGWVYVGVNGGIVGLKGKTKEQAQR